MDCNVILMLKSLVASNDTLHPYQSCTESNDNGNNMSIASNDSEDPYYISEKGQQGHWEDIGKDIHAYASPFIIAIGLIGNLISLRVFTSRQLRKLSASFYLIALSASDSIVLLTSVLLEWLYKGLPRWPGGHKVGTINIQGVCQLFLFVSYTFRFVSVYLIVIFTIERYIAVCKPLQRRRICTKSFARRIIVAVHLVGALISVYKPLLSGVFKLTSPTQIDDGIDADLLSTNDVTNSSSTILYGSGSDTLNIPNQYICTRNMEFNQMNLIMELTYGLTITALPFVIITIFNLLILQRLVRGDSVSSNLKVQKNRIRLELTIMLLAISTSFILLNLPYFVVWVQQYLQSVHPQGPQAAHEIRKNLFITKTIFSLNYSINFFVYCMTGTYYRNVIKRMVMCRRDPSRLLAHVPSSPTCRTEVREMSSVK